jgi:catechol 2,3-dioxygenase-like lactoylglutathione lyase family enzyme
MPAQLEAVHPVLMVRDVPAAVRFYESLGFTRAFQDAPEAPRYAGVRRDGVELHLQWHSPEEWQVFTQGDRPNYRFYVSAVDDYFAELRERGALPATAEVRDTPWGTREFHLRDRDGNGLQFYRNR